MTKYFEVVRRDGPARMGKLLLERSISTPGFITSEDYVTAGSVFGFASVDEAISAHEAIRGPKEAGHFALCSRSPALRANPGAASHGDRWTWTQRRIDPSLQRKEDQKMQMSMCWAMPGLSKTPETW